MKKKTITAIGHVVSKNLISISVGATVSVAKNLMNEKRIRHLPVIDDKNEIVGVVTSRNLANAESIQQFPVDLFMISPVEFINQKESLRASILKMLEMKISCLLVVDDKDEVVGIVTTDDILWHLAHLLREESDESRHFITAMGLQIIGDIANKLSIMGI